MILAPFDGSIYGFLFVLSLLDVIMFSLFGVLNCVACMTGRLSQAKVLLPLSRLSTGVFSLNLFSQQSIRYLFFHP